jgi:hypothetical protein
MQQEQLLAQKVVVEGQEPSPVARLHAADRDKELQLVRRVDWRFLLPDPRLRHLAYLGPKNGLLLEALQHFSEPFSIISWSDLPDYRPGIHSGFDLAIVHSPRAVDLEGVHSIIGDGGYLYWEIDRSAWGQRWRMRHFRKYVTALTEVGFDDIRASWHRPNFDSCLEVIPLDDEIALRYVFSRHKGKLTGRIQKAAGKFLAENDLLSRFASSLSIVARKSQSSEVAG